MCGAPVGLLGTANRLSIGIARPCELLAIGGPLRRHPSVALVPFSGAGAQLAARPAGCRGGGMRAKPSQGSLRRRQSADDSGSPPGCRLDRDGSAVQLDQALDQCETETSARLACPALEFLKDSGLVGLRNSDPG